MIFGYSCGANFGAKEKGLAFGVFVSP